MQGQFAMKQATLHKLLLAFLLIPAALLADDNLEGAYERVSLVNSRTGEAPEAVNRKGLLIFADGHYAMLTMNPDRRHASREAVAKMSDKQEIEYLRQWLDVNAHSGRYETQGRTLTWHRDISEDPGEVGTATKLGFERRDDLLILRFTLPNGDAYLWTWRRL